MKEKRRMFTVVELGFRGTKMFSEGFPDQKSLGTADLGNNFFKNKFNFDGKVPEIILIFCSFCKLFFAKPTKRCLKTRNN